MKNSLLLLILTASLQASAQLLTVTGIEQIKTPLQVSEAAISPDGEYVIANTYDDNKLWQIPLEGAGEARSIADNGTLYLIQFTPDSKQVVYIDEYADANHLRYKQVKTVDLQSMQTRQLHAPTRTFNGISISGNEVVMIDDMQASRRQIETTKAAKPHPVASVYYGQLMLTTGNKTVALNPNGKEGCSYLWPSVSPDGTKVLYYLGSTGAFVCNIDGSNVTPVGKMLAPCWMDNNTIVGMVNTDDGSQITSSYLIASNLNGVSQVLTPDSLIAMYPTVSADGKTIVFTAQEGKLYKLNLK